MEMSKSIKKERHSNTIVTNEKLEKERNEQRKTELRNRITRNRINTEWNEKRSKENKEHKRNWMDHEINNNDDTNEIAYRINENE